MTTTPNTDPHDKARAALPTYLSNWRHKHGLSVADAQRILLEHLKREQNKAKSKPKPPRPSQTPT